MSETTTVDEAPSSLPPGQAHNTDGRCENRPRHVALTPMQMRVLREVCRDGAPSGVIAKRMFLSPKTVCSHLWRIHQKTETLSRAELVAAVLNGHVEPILAVRATAASRVSMLNPLYSEEAE